MKYKILFDYGEHDGFRFEKEEFDDIDKAVKHAIELTKYFCVPFLIVSVIDWKVINA